MPILGRDPLPAIVSFAREDVRVRALILNGSRARADAQLDLFSDTDVALVVDDLEAFVADQGTSKAGVLGKGLRQRLDGPTWTELEQTYAGGGVLTSGRRSGGLVLSSGRQPARSRSGWVMSTRMTWTSA